MPGRHPIGWLVMSIGGDGPPALGDLHPTQAEALAEMAGVLAVAREGGSKLIVEAGGTYAYDVDRDWEWTVEAVFGAGS